MVNKYLKLIIFSFLPVIILLFMFEVAVRIKYYYYQNRNPFYLLTPFQDCFGYYKIRKTNINLKGNDIIKVPEPCKDEEVFDEVNNKKTRYTFNDDCFRGKEYKRKKSESVFRIVMVGGSTVFGTGVSDNETMPYYLEEILNKSNGKYEVINAGNAGYDAPKILNLIKNKVILYNPDMILYYEAFNDAKPSGMPWPDDDIGAINQLKNIRGFIHRLLHYKLLSYTYLTEKYYFYLEKRKKIQYAQLRISDDFEENINNIFSFSNSKNIKIVFVKQVIREPVVVDSINTLDSSQIQIKYKEVIRNGEKYKDRIDDVTAINQRYVLYLTEKIASKYSVPVIDFVDEYDKSVPKELFTDIVHQTSEGNKILANYIYNELMKKNLITSK